MKYVNCNYNPLAIKTCDCVIRAILKATGQTWPETFDGLCRLARQECRMPNDKPVYNQYLRHLGFEMQKMPRFPDNTRYTVREFADANPIGTFIISIANHLTVIIDGVLYDTWDCSRKSVGNYWM